MKLAKKMLDIDGEQLFCEFELRETNAVIMHGAGATTDHTKAYNLAEALLTRGIGVSLFDFSGHGQSSGQLSELSLERRQRQAIGVIEAMAPEGLLYLVGFSMSGQTVCDVLPHLMSRVKGVLLGCPAMYGQAAWQLPFGNPGFTSILRTPESWAQSRAPDFLRQFKGRVVIAAGSEDAVIPAGVTELFRQAAPQHVYKEYPGVSHRLLAWLSEHPKAADELIGLFVD